MPETLRFMHPLFDHVDFASVNLESPVLENLTSVHPTKEYAFLVYRIHFQP